MGGNSSKEVQLYKNARTDFERTERNLRDAYTEASKHKDKIIKNGLSRFLELQQRSNGQTNEIRELRQQLEELLDEKIRLKESELDIFIKRLGIERGRVSELKKAYRVLIRARENFNRDEIDEANDKIEEIKDRMLSGKWFAWKIGIDNMQELCCKCEDIIELNEKKIKICGQRYEATQVVTRFSNFWE